MIWKGHISFGLVNIPVALYPAETANALDFTLLDLKDFSPIGYRKVNKATGAEVPGSRIVRGFEYAKGRHVVVTDDDLRRASPERTQRIDILSFADQSEIDPRYFDRPYYLAPSGVKNEKGYALLRDVLRKTGKVGIASVVIRARQHLAALFPRDRALVLNTLRFASELRDPADLSPSGTSAQTLGITAKETEMAERLVTDMVEPWAPEKYRDEYQDELLDFIRQRAKAGKLEHVEEAAPPREPKGEVVHITELLKRSLDRMPKRTPAARRASRRSA
jgi:DNA end-binding protein Ku